MDSKRQCHLVFLVLAAQLPHLSPSRMTVCGFLKTSTTIYKVSRHTHSHLQAHAAHCFSQSLSFHLKGRKFQVSVYSHCVLSVPHLSSQMTLPGAQFSLLLCVFSSSETLPERTLPLSPELHSPTPVR